MVSGKVFGDCLFQVSVLHVDDHEILHNYIYMSSDFSPMRGQVSTCKAEVFCV